MLELKLSMDFFFEIMNNLRNLLSDELRLKFHHMLVMGF